ncbi:MerR family transcriptional regulator [bacterium]|nr:MerR family transcriptional regulator [FCB group bacterium]MBL7191711.1 MerR family transcriptional regulator [bacterium]
MKNKHEPIFSIGEAAKALGILVPVLRNLEKANLLITVRTAHGKRLFSQCDIDYIRGLMKHAAKKGVTLEQIMKELNNIKCWEIVECDLEPRHRCPKYNQQGQPCWARSDITCEYQSQNCHECPVYLSIPKALGIAQ